MKVTFSGVAKPLIVVAMLVTLPTIPHAALGRPQQASPLPAGDLAWGMFLGTFSEDEGFALRGGDFPAMAGSIRIDGSELVLTFTGEVPFEGCDG